MTDSTMQIFREIPFFRRLLLLLCVAYVIINKRSFQSFMCLHLIGDSICTKHQTPILCFSKSCLLPCVVGSEEVFSMYKHRDVVKGCQPHPGDIVEAAPLAVSHACFVCRCKIIMVMLKGICVAPIFHTTKICTAPLFHNKGICIAPIFHTTKICTAPIFHNKGICIAPIFHTRWEPRAFTVTPATIRHTGRCACTHTN